MLIQVLLLLSVVVLLVVFVRSTHGVRIRAGKRIGLIAFALLNVYAVLRPEDVTVLARWLGVGRGTDLVLYALVVAFLVGMLNYYLRFQGVDRQLTELARTLAVREAELVNRERGVLPPDDGVATSVLPAHPEPENTPR